MRFNTEWKVCFDAVTEFELVDPKLTDGDIVFEVSRNYDGIFPEEHFDVQVYLQIGKIHFEVHEGGFDLKDEEKVAMMSYLISNNYLDRIGAL